MAMQATAAADIRDIQEVLRLAREESIREIQYSCNNIGDLQDHIYTVGARFRFHDPQDFTFARQLHHLYSTYFTSRREGVVEVPREQIIRDLVHKLNHIHTAKRLWPESSWLSGHTPVPSWYTAEERANVGGVDSGIYKLLVRALGYAPLSAPSQDALDKIWNALYPASSIDDDVESALRISDAERYAVVSYIQYAGGGKKPPATWTSEVDSVLTTLASLSIITEKAVWFDKLASRQYGDSQKWWGAVATMQFLFNPVIVVLPRMSEQQEFVQTVGQTTWGSQEADKIFQSFVEHAKHCSDCRSSLPLQWALQQDWVLPVAALRTWPRVEHALGANGLGLFSSETTYVALTALLTCTFAMLAVLIKNDRDLLDVLSRANLLPSCLIAEDDSILQLAWVHISCSVWQHGHSTSQGTCIAALKEIASCAMELYHLFCKLQTPKQLAMQAIGPEDDDGWKILHVDVDLYRVRLPSWTLFYPKVRGEELVTREQEIDIPTLARYNSNDMYDTGAHSMPLRAFAHLQLHWAALNIHRNLEVTMRGRKQSMSSHQFLVARHKALTTLVYTRAAQAPCYAWDDKLVAAILLSSPRVFINAFQIWDDKIWAGGQMMADFLGALRAAGVLAEGEDVKLEPNTLIVALSMQRKQTVHRLIPRPSSSADQDYPVHVIPLASYTAPMDSCTSGTQKCFPGFFLGLLPLKAVDALRFRTSAGTALPKLNDWVYQRLQEIATKDWNIVVVRQVRTLEQQTGQCWHCQMLVRGGLNTPGSSQAPETSVFPYSTSCTVENDITWGIGSFDPLNPGALFNDEYYFGLHPDCAAVLLQRSGSSENAWYAHSLAHFAILGSMAVHACSSCYALIVEERDRSTLSTLAFWTILPLQDKHRAVCLGNIGVIGVASYEAELPARVLHL